MSDDLCGICNHTEPPVGKKKRARKQKKDSVEEIRWICCDACQKWFHAKCVRISDALFSEIKSYIYLCESCTVIGSLTRIAPVPACRSNLVEIQKRIDDLAQQILKLNSEISNLQGSVKKQIDRVQNKISHIDQAKIHATSPKLPVDLDQKVQIIESGAKLAKLCSQSINGHRISINKVPYREGENVRAIVENFLNFLGINNMMSHVVSCFRLPIKPSKWTDRTLTPTIAVVFDVAEVRSEVLKKYFQLHKQAKLCNLKTGLPLEYRFTVNEMLSIKSFRVRNLALRLKQQKLIQSVFVKNDHISVRLPNQKKYIPVDDSNELIKLVDSTPCPDETSIFYDAESTRTSTLC